MMRLSLTGYFLVVTMSMIAVAVSAYQESENTVEKQDPLDEAWSKLAMSEPESTEAILFFAQRPDKAVKYFDKHLQALRLDEDDFARLTKDLASDDKDVAKAAFEELEYRDPRILFGLKEIMDRIDENPARSRMAEVLSCRKFDSMADQDVELRQINGNEEGEEDFFNFIVGNGSFWVESRIERLGTTPFLTKNKWDRAIRVIKILESIKTPEAVAVISRLAQGHVDARPSKIAKKIAMRLKLEQSKKK